MNRRKRMVASLPMYLPGSNAVQALWSAIATRLAQRLPDTRTATLISPADLHAHWREPTLLLSQTCGYPLATALRDSVQVVGTWAFDAPGCSGMACRSQFIRRHSDARTLLAQFAGSTFAFNSRDSQSGYNAPRAFIAASQAKLPFFATGLETGGHTESIEAVRSGRADMAAIDCVTLALWRDNNPALAGDIAACGETAAYPGLPLITAASTAPATLAAIRECLASVATHPQCHPVRSPLRIVGFETSTLADYDICLYMEKAGRPLFESPD